MVHTCHPELGRRRQEDWDLKVSQDETLSQALKNKTKQQQNSKVWGDSSRAVELVAQPGKPGPILRTTSWEERRQRSELPSDLHMHAVPHNEEMHKEVEKFKE